jgi:hypothetical protein
MTGSSSACGEGRHCQGQAADSFASRGPREKPSGMLIRVGGRNGSYQPMRQSAEPVPGSEGALRLPHDNPHQMCGIKRYFTLCWYSI